MPAYRDKRNNKWRWKKQITLPDGESKTMWGTPLINTKEAALAAERDALELVLYRFRNPVAAKKKEVPTFQDWFYGSADPNDRDAEPNGRFWLEHVIAEKNKPAEQESKKSVMRVHLNPFFGRMKLDEIAVPDIKRFKAHLVQLKSRRKRPLSDKSINNILAVLSKMLKYAAEAELIDHVPRIGLLKVERPEILPWGFDEYGRLLQAARDEGDWWYAAICLAGEAGMRVGEVKALRWREDVDIVAGTITVNQQTRKGIVGTPKGRTRRVVPMTDRVWTALKGLSMVREGVVVRNVDGTPLTDRQAQAALRRICRRAGLPERPWHVLRHTFATHAAMFGVNPWSLQSWLGHKRIEETMIYVSYANAHRTPIPADVLAAGTGEIDPDRRVLKMLGARGVGSAAPLDSVNVAETAKEEERKNLRLQLLT